MKCKLYHNTSDNIVVNKSISQVGNEHTVHLKDDTDVINPIMTISREINIKDINYLYVTELKRYYYIDSYETSMQYYILHCKVDVLMSYKDEILKQRAIIARNESLGKFYLEDNRQRIYQPTRVKTKSFPSGFLVGGKKVSNFIITLNGGATS